jgi:hypothetical protein
MAAVGDQLERIYRDIWSWPSDVDGELESK